MTNLPEDWDALPLDGKERMAQEPPAIPHETLGDDTPADDRESVARRILNEWRHQQNRADWADDLRAIGKAEVLLYEILEFMGVD